MREKFLDELNAFLEPHSVRGPRIFRDWLIKKSGSSIESQNHLYFFAREDEDDLYLSLDKGLKKEDRKKLLGFLKQDKHIDSIKESPKLYMRIALPKELKDYLNSYILLQGEDKLYYVNQNGLLLEKKLSQAMSGEAYYHLKANLRQLWAQATDKRAILYKLSHKQLRHWIQEELTDTLIPLSKALLSKNLKAFKKDLANEGFFSPEEWRTYQILSTKDLETKPIENMLDLVENLKTATAIAEKLKNIIVVDESLKVEAAAILTEAEANKSQEKNIAKEPSKSIDNEPMAIEKPSSENGPVKEDTFSFLLDRLHKGIKDYRKINYYSSFSSHYKFAWKLEGEELKQDTLYIHPLEKDASSFKYTVQTAEKEPIEDEVHEFYPLTSPFSMEKLQTHKENVLKLLLERKHLSYGYVEQAKEIIKSFERLEELELPSPELAPLLASLKEAVLEFEKKNQAMEKTLNDGFCHEITEFFSQLGISTRDTDIFEHLILRLAGVQVLPCYSRFQDSGNQFRLSLNLSYKSKIIEKASPIETLMEKLIHPVDPSALILSKIRVDRYGQKSGFSSSYDAIIIESSNHENHCFSFNPNTPMSYSLSLDAGIFREKIWPKIKEMALELAQNKPEELEPYKKASKSLHKKIAPSLPVAETPAALEAEAKIKPLPLDSKAPEEKEPLESPEVKSQGLSSSLGFFKSQSSPRTETESKEIEKTSAVEKTKEPRVEETDGLIYVALS